ncbi:MAG: U32 family peptidase [Planctomycetaceae bacterium]|jgi:putative protease|nr:U32 family peptidase [Planctomycetaceae bacterium]
MFQQLPELLSPAGDEESLHAALENGADAVYFGIAIPDKYNARTRAKNIPLDNLKRIMQLLHNRSMNGYVTLNTLVHDDELPEIESLLREIVTSGVDAIIVQDFGLAALANQFCPHLPIHASTQMSLTSAQSINLAASLGLKRIILPRELSLQQIRSIRNSTRLELETFIHGSLCISFSGQCYASLSLGGRSANRGCCAQPCRMPYSLINANRTSNPLQLISPSDLSALPVLEQLISTGINSLKIEGRLKPAEYVAEVTRTYRKALDYIKQKNQNNIADNNKNNDNKNDNNKIIPQDTTRLEMIFSRGLTTGWLDKVEPRNLVTGNVMAHRGIEIGKVIEVRRDAVVVKLSGTIQRGDGVLFENIEHPDHSQGGRVYEIIRKGESVQKCTENIKLLLTFANNSIDPQFVKPQQSVRKTNDPEIEREIKKSLNSKITKRKITINLKIIAIAGKPLKLSAETTTGATCEIICNDNLETAIKHPITPEMLRTQFDRIGDTIFTIGNINATIEGAPMIPLSQLGKLRRELITKLENFTPPPKTKIEFQDNLETIKNKIKISRQNIFVTKNKNITAANKSNSITKSNSVTIHFLSREISVFEDTELLQQIIATGCNSFYAELDNFDEYIFASNTVRRNGCEFTPVLPRIILPDENWSPEKFMALRPDAVLTRNCEELSYFKDRNVPIIADFSFNTINELSFQKLLEWGVDRITPAFDLGADQMESFCNRIPKELVELIVFGRAPLFTMNHCIWRANIIPQGKPCGKICKKIPLKIKDRRGAIHTIRTDILCKNIIENAAEYEIKPIKGIKHIRIEWDKRLGDPVKIIEKIKSNL